MKSFSVGAALAAGVSTVAAACSNAGQTVQYNTNNGDKSYNQFVLYTAGQDDAVVERADPITNPGGVAGHVHQVFGASGFAPQLDYDILQESACTTLDGGGSGMGLLPDKSSYWHPALYAELKDDSGYIRIPTSGHKIYYKTAGQEHDIPGGQQPYEPFGFPPGFRMIAGNMAKRTPYTQNHPQNWMCHSKSGTPTGTNGGFPKFDQACDSYPGFNADITFPHCWNGKDYVKDAEVPHVVYPDGDPTSGPCPSTHNIRLPVIFVENEFNQASVYNKIKPNSYVLSNGDPTGYGFHFDFFNGWNNGSIAELFQTACQPNFAASDNSNYAQFEAPGLSKDCYAQYKPGTTFKENVDGPFKQLPGCNPIIATEPVPKNAPAPLGSNQCSAAGTVPATGDDAGTTAASNTSANTGATDAESSGSSATGMSGGAAESSSASSADKATATQADSAGVTPVAKEVVPVSENGQTVWITDFVYVTVTVYGQ